MKDMTAILFRYSDEAGVHQAVSTLKRLGPRLKSIIVLHEWKTPPHVMQGRIKYLSAISEDSAYLLNDIICQLNTSYVLFFQDTDYLSPTVNPESLTLPRKKDVLITPYHHRDILINRPILVRTSVFKKVPFPSQGQLPFKEALFPAWLTNIKKSQQSRKRDVIRQSKINRSPDTLQKEKIMGKYQLKKGRTCPTLSVIMSTYNMEKFVEAAVASCLFQNNTFDEILIMDDGSTDHSYQLLQRLAKANGITVYRKKNAGKARALNDLLPHVTSRFILELDADDWLDPDACDVIKKQLSVLNDDVSVLYGNLRKWKQSAAGVLFKETTKGMIIKGRDELFTYRLPLGPRIYRTSILKKEGGFPVIKFGDGRLYEDVSILYRLLGKYPFRYRDFTVYNVREHYDSITHNNILRWHEFLKSFRYQ